MARSRLAVPLIFGFFGLVGCQPLGLPLPGFDEDRAYYDPDFVGQWVLADGYGSTNGDFRLTVRQDPLSRVSYVAQIKSGSDPESEDRERGRLPNIKLVKIKHSLIVDIADPFQADHGSHYLFQAVKQGQSIHLYQLNSVEVFKSVMKSAKNTHNPPLDNRISTLQLTRFVEDHLGDRSAWDKRYIMKPLKSSPR